MSAPRVIHVAAGAIRDARGRVLVTRRPDHVHQGGLWEFPGGKIEPGETAAQGLHRELDEELGVRVLAFRPLIRIPHDYGDRRVVLHVFLVSAHDGEPAPREGQPMSWRHPDAMDPAVFPAADRPIINALRLPGLYLITGSDPTRPEPFLRRLEDALARGVRLVQLRAHALNTADYQALAERAFALCERFGARLILNGDPRKVHALPAHGIHLTGERLWQLETRPAGDGRWAGASCHGAEDLDRARALGLDYALLAPVKPTATHPGSTPLGWSRFASLAEDAALPVFALGGLAPADLDEAARHGAQGIAAIRGLWPKDPPR
jgi:8-oxo-dGTP diphosphatase